jgi:hypothetical protein
MVKELKGQTDGAVQEILQDFRIKEQIAFAGS